MDTATAFLRFLQVKGERDRLVCPNVAYSIKEPEDNIATWEDSDNIPSVSDSDKFNFSTGFKDSDSLKSDDDPATELVCVNNMFHEHK